MLKVFLSLLIMMFSLASAFAQENTPLSPEQIEQIPFSESRGPNSNISEDITSTIDMTADREGHVTEYDAEATGGKAGLPQFNTETFASQIFWLAIAFVILYFYFSRKALPALSSVMDERRMTIRKDLEQADQLSADVENTRLAYEAAMAKAHEKASQAITDTESHMRDQSNKAFDDYREKSAAAVADLEAQAEAEKNRIKMDLAATAKELTSIIINKLSPLSVKESDIETAVSENMDAPSKTETKKAA
jgi:F-type H+-transporting ATPase subunit b